MIRPDTAESTFTVSYKGSNIFRILDVFFVLRPTLMFPLFTMVLAGHQIAVARRTLDWQQWSMLIIGLIALFGVVYLLNQLRDRKSDNSINACGLDSDYYASIVLPEVWRKVPGKRFQSAGRLSGG